MRKEIAIAFMGLMLCGSVFADGTKPPPPKPTCDAVCLIRIGGSGGTPPPGVTKGVVIHDRIDLPKLPPRKAPTDFDPEGPPCGNGPGCGQCYQCTNVGNGQYACVHVDGCKPT